MMKRLLVLATVAVAFGGVVTEALAEEVRMGRTRGISQLAGLVAETKGFFKEQGLDVEFKSVSRGNVALQAMAGGNLDFAESAHAPFLAAVARGVPLVAVGVTSRGFMGKLVAAPKNADLKSLADFKGKRIGIQVGTGVHTVVLMLLKEQGLDPKDFNFTNIRVVDMPAAMAAPTHNFDAVIGWEPGMTRIVRAGHGKMIVEAKVFEDQAKITYPFLLSTTQDYYKNNPEVVQKVVNAYSKAHKYIRENKDEAVNIFTDAAKARGAKLTEDVVKVMLFDTDRFGGAGFTDGDMKDLPSTRDFMVAIGKLKSPPDLSKAIDQSYGDKAEGALTN